MKYLLIMLLSVLALFPSCDAGGNAIEKTGLKVIMENENTRGFAPHSMDVDHYELRVVNQDKEIQYGPHIARPGDPALLLSVEAGHCIVSVDAFNSSNIIVGVGSSEVNVEFGKVATCNVSVMEEKGNGTISFSVKGISSDTVKACLYIASGFETSKPVYSSVLANDPDTGLFEGEMKVPNGYYVVVLEDANGVRLGNFDTCRIVKDCNIVCTLDEGRNLIFANAGNV